MKEWTTPQSLRPLSLGQTQRGTKEERTKMCLSHQTSPLFFFFCTDLLGESSWTGFNNEFTLTEYSSIIALGIWLTRCEQKQTGQRCNVKKYRHVWILPDQKPSTASFIFQGCFQYSSPGEYGLSSYCCVNENYSSYCNHLSLVCFGFPPLTCCLGQHHYACRSKNMPIRITQLLTLR